MPISRIKTDGIQDDAITSAKIGVDVIVADDLAANSVTVSEITDGAVTGAKLANNLNYDSGTLYLDSTNDRVGIGTTSPSGVLHLSANTNDTTLPSIVLQDTGTTSTRLGVLTNTSGDINLSATSSLTDIRATVSVRDDRSILFNTAGSEAMRIDSLGNVGIGTSSPSELLEVNSTGASTAIEISAGLASTTTGEAKLVLRSLHSSSGTVYSRSEIASLGVAGGDSDLIFRTTSDASGPVEHMRITSEGNVGIGTNNPSTFGKLAIQVDGTTTPTNAANVGPSSINLYAATNGSSTNSTVGIFGWQASQPGIGSGIGFSRENAVDWGSQIRFYTHPTTTSNISDITERMRITADGNVGIGTTNPDTNSQLHVRNDNADAKITLQTSETYDCYINFSGATSEASIGYEPTSNAIVFANAADGITSNERMRIDTTGRVLIGTTETSVTSTDDGIVLTQDGNLIARRAGTVAYWTRLSVTGTHNVHVFYANTSPVGSISVNSSSTAYNTSSDYRLKENVVADWDATTRLKQLNPVRFNFIAEPDTTVDGFLAHEVQSVVPEAITGTHDEVDDDGNPVYQGIDQSKLVPLLVKTIQELEARITALESN